MDKFTNNDKQPRGGALMSIASMIFGIISITFLFIYPNITSITSIIGIVLASISITKRMPDKTAALTGLILSITSIAFFLFSLILIICIFIFSYNDPFITRP